MCDLENIGQGHVVQHSHWHYAMLILTSIKLMLEHFSLAHRFPDIIYYMIPRHFVTLKI